MNWFVLVLSGVLEAVWAVALGKSDGFSRPLPTVTFVVGLVLSMAKVVLITGLVACVVGLKLVH